MNTTLRPITNSNSHRTTSSLPICARTFPRVATYENGTLDDRMVAVAGVHALWERDKPDPSALLTMFVRSAPAWMKDALCAEPRYSGADWFPERGVAPSAVARAKAVCTSCLCQSACLGFALDFPEQLPGVWGGATERERKALRARGIDGRLVAEYGVHAADFTWLASPSLVPPIVTDGH